MKNLKKAIVKAVLVLLLGAIWGIGSAGISAVSSASSTPIVSPDGNQLIYDRRRSNDGMSAPLLILMHGYGSSMKDIGWMANMIDPRFEIYNVQAPYKNGDGFAWYEITWEEGKPTGMNKKQESKSLDRIIDFVKTRIGSNTDRKVYLMGFSQGAIMSITGALSHPNLIDGAVVMSGRKSSGDAVVAKEGLDKLDVLITHGSQDEVIPFADAQKLAEECKALGIKTDFRQYEMGHTLGKKCWEDVNAWLAQRAKS